MKLIALLIATSGISPQYIEQVAGHDYSNALTLIQSDEKVIDEVATNYHVNPVLLKSIVFPEYIRFNAFQGLIEESSLELLYVNFGTNKVDFSIGKFQMKPSFAVGLENKISKNVQLSNKYNILSFNSSNDKENRKTRIARLKDVKWQSIYLSAFIDYCLINYKIKFQSIEEEVKFLSTVYNVGLTNHEEITNSYNRRAFPYGSKYQINQCYYWEVALDYYIKASNKK